MYFIFNILEVYDDGSPAHNICGQTPLPQRTIDFVIYRSLGALKADVQLEGIDILNLNDASIDALPATPFAVGATGLTVESITRSLATGTLAFEISGINVYDEKTLSARFTKANRFTYENSFKLFGYDLGNAVGISEGNPDIDVVLINNTNIIDMYGLQTKTFSKFTTYQKPFTNKTLVYNLVGTTGEITYTNVDTTAGIGGGQNAIVCSITGLNIEQTIIVRDKDCNIYDTCQSTEEVIQAIWFPPVNKSVYSALNCDSECTSNLDTNSIELNLDYASVDVYQINGESTWLFCHDIPTANLYQQLVFELYDFNGQIIETETIDITNYYADYIADPSIITPTTFNFDLPVFGDVVVKVKYQILKESDDSILVECIKTQGYNSCNFWKVVNGAECGQFTVKNCSLKDGLLNIYQLQADKTFTNILEDEDVDAMTNLDVNLDSDGVYTFVFIAKEEGAEEQTFVIFNYCNFKTCYFTFLQKVLCTDICEDCNKKGYYDFNSFSLNAQMFLALMNAENGFNYLYTAIDTAKIEELYNIKTFIDRLNEYCNNSCGCSTCT